MQKNNQRVILLWLFTGCFLVFAMVILGGITRLTGSGLSITEWKPIMGTIPPLNHDAWLVAFEKYKLSPQFKLVNYNMQLAEFKSIFFWEYFHRLVGRLLGVVFIVPFLYFLWKKMLSPLLVRQLAMVFVLGAFQGFLGWYMVKSGLVDNPAVSHYRLAAHLITAFLSFGYIFWVALGIIYSDAESRQKRQVPNNRLFIGIAVGIFGLVILQIIYGAFVAGLHAGKVFNTWPMMGDSWFPESITALKPIWQNFFSNMIGVQFVHRSLALLLLLSGIWLIIKFRRFPDPDMKSAVIYFLGALILQFCLGVITLLWSAPVLLSVLHQMGGFILFSTSVFLLNRALKPEKKETRSGLPIAA